MRRQREIRLALLVEIADVVAWLRFDNKDLTGSGRERKRNRNLMMMLT